MLPLWLNSIHTFAPHHLALLTDKEQLTYGDLCKKVAKIKTLLQEKKLENKQHILLAVTNEHHFLCLLMGACSLGLTVMIADPELPHASAQELLQKFEPDLVIVDQQIENRWKQSKKNWIINPEPVEKKGTLFKRLLGNSQEPLQGFFSEIDQVEKCESRDPNIHPEDIALIFFTSGSTSLPKAVQISHRALDAHLHTLSQQHRYNSLSRLLNPLPFHHADGLVQGPLVAFFSGASVYRPLSFNPSHIPYFLDQIYARSITHFIAVPTLLSLILRLGSAQNDSFNFPEFSHIISTAGFLDENLWRKFEEHFKVKICNTYGLTETVAGGIFCGPHEHTRKIGTIGKPVDCAIRIVDSIGKNVSQGETGQLLLCGKNLMSGYYKNELETQKAMPDEWLHTGDLVKADSDGFIYFLGRLKNIIVCGGHNIHPQEVDDVIAKHPQIQAVATFALAHPDWEWIAVSAVVLSKDAILTEVDVIEHCRLFLPSYKIPRHIYFLTELPYGPSGKVRIETLKEMCLAIPSLSKQEKNYYETILSLATQVFKTPRENLNMSSGPHNTAGWDSLAHIEFIVSLEKEFAINISNTDILSITDLKSTLQVVERILSHA
ncbi:MAG: AMP-binding protein [Bacteriovoracaceae bacterium]|nr:AMP-binding protein [Bacteriovoracaceae bacterium]